MNTKMIFLDIDGTLTEPGKNAPPASAQEAVQRARARGHKVLLCSGRNRGMLSPLLQYGFDGFAGSAGGYIEYGGQVVYDCPMTAEQQRRVLAGFRDSGVFCTVECLDRTYTDDGFKDFLRGQRHGSSELLRWREQLENSLGILPLALYQGEPVYKLVFMCPEREQLRDLESAFGEEFNFCIQDTNQFGLTNGELINKKFDKGAAIRRLSDHTGIPIEDTIAFGDSMNDLEMIQTAGLGICMANGSETLRLAADEVCPSVSEDGLYHAFSCHGLM